jgi:Zn-dependent peptidase ImmA (M78 family)
MLKLEINPWEIIINVVNRLYPYFSATISFLPPDEFKAALQSTQTDQPCIGKEDACGFTFFEPDQNPIIMIDSNIPCQHSVEIIAHEVAHVVAGVKAGHGKKWEAEFERIFQAYGKEHERICNEIYG